VAAVLQVMQGTIDRGESLEDAVLAPRLSVTGTAAQGRARVYLEGVVWDDPLAALDPTSPGWSEQDEAVLRARGFQIAEQPGGPWPTGMDPWFGGVNAVGRNGDGWTAVGDDRRDGVGGVLVKGSPSLQRADRAFSEPRAAPGR
jgi:gamma-glutamyltranspeptidase